MQLAPRVALSNGRVQDSGFDELAARLGRLLTEPRALEIKARTSAEGRVSDARTEIRLDADAMLGQQGSMMCRWASTIVSAAADRRQRPGVVGSYGLGTWLIPVMKPTKSALCFDTTSAGP